ncbi:MAG: hypothetical protein ABI562_02795 [Chloroflexota bacterium]
MSDHKSEVSPTGQEVEFSTNGTDPAGAYGYEGEGAGEGRHFLDELAKAMQSTAAAEQARNAEGTEQRRQSHIDAIRAREAIEAEDLRELAKEDVKSIDAWSDGEIKRIKLERERRIAARREQLQVRLEEHRTVVGREVETVEAAVAAYRADIEQYFRRLESETDPVVIAKSAGSRPPFPDLELVGSDGVPIASDAYSPAIEMPASAPAEAVYEAPIEAPVIEEPPQAEAPASEAPVEEADAEETHHDVVQEAAVEDAGAPEADGAAVDDSVMIGVMEAEVAQEPSEAAWAAESGEAVTADSTDSAEPVAASSETPAEAGEAEEGEPVAAGAESVVVMPRSTSAGSWLRWPNNSGGDSDH